MNLSRMYRLLENGLGWSLLTILWIFFSYIVSVPERFLPSPGSVLSGMWGLQPPLYSHAVATTLRVLIGTLTGTVAGISLALLITTFDGFRRMILPSIMMLRAVPPVATVPFFLLWFGFSEEGKFLLVAMGVGLNIVVASTQILEQTDERFIVALSSFHTSLRSYPFSVSLPLVLQGLLPTLRASVAIILGASIVSELLGSQVGLGYLIQTSRTTYSMNVVFLATLILGIIASLLDWWIVACWKILVFWKRSSHQRTPHGS